MEGDEDSSACVTVVASVTNNEKERKKRAKDKCQDPGKLSWEDVYNHKKDKGFKSKIRINRKAFNFVLNEIHDDIVMSPTNLNLFPTSLDRQLAMTLYRFATGCTYATLSDLFGVSVRQQIIFLIRYVKFSLPSSTIALFIYHLQMPNGKQRSVGFLKTMKSHVLVHGMSSMFISIQN